MWIIDIIKIVSIIFATATQHKLFFWLQILGNYIKIYIKLHYGSQFKERNGKAFNDKCVYILTLIFHILSQIIALSHPLKMIMQKFL